jgi:hypothetical protein
VVPFFQSKLNLENEIIQRKGAVQAFYQNGSGRRSACRQVDNLAVDANACCIRHRAVDARTRKSIQENINE